MWAPQVTLTSAAAIALVRSEASIAATSAISASSAARRSGVSLPNSRASCSSGASLAWIPLAAYRPGASGEPPDRITLARTP
jgi:hypothetical protein